MNIVLLTNILTPYRRTFYDHLYHEFRNRGINFTILVMANSEPERHWDYEEYKTNYTRILPHITLKLRNSFTHINFSIKNVLKELNPNIVVVSGSYTYPVTWSTIILKNFFNYKLLFWSESHLNESRDYSAFKIFIREKLRKIIYSRFDGFWYAGKMSRRFIEKYAKEKVEMYFIPNLVNNNVFGNSNVIDEINNEEIMKEYGLDSGKFIFLCPARLNPVKGIDKFLKVYSKNSLKDKAVILIAGDGEQKKEIESLIMSLGIDVRLVGYKSEEEIVKLYSLSDCFLLPSISDPNPLTAIEALWSGKPLLVSNHVGNHPEVVIDGENGFVFDYRQERKTINYIEQVIGSTGEWKARAKQTSLQIANNHYEPKKAVLNLIADMLNN